MPSLLAIVAVALLCGYSLFTLERELQHPVVDTYLPYGVLGASNSAGVLAMFATPVLTVLAALALADRKRLCGAADEEEAPSPTPNLAPAPSTMPEPEVFQSAEDPAYTRSCAAAAAGLQRVLDVQQSEHELHELLERLEKKHGLRYCPDPEQDDEVDDGPGEETTGHHAALDASAKALRSLVMRFPEKSAGVLETNHFRWAKGVAPLRVAGYNELDTELATWTDKTTSAADSALFSTLGCWVSPFTQPALALWGVGFAVQGLGLGLGLPLWGRCRAGT